MENLTSTMHIVGNTIVASLFSLTQILQQPYNRSTGQGLWSERRNTKHVNLQNQQLDQYRFANGAGGSDLLLDAEARDISQEDQATSYMTLY